MVKIKHALAAIAAVGLVTSPALAATRSAKSLPNSYSIEPSTGQCVEIRRGSTVPVPVDQAFCKVAEAGASNGVGNAAAAATGSGLGFSPAFLLALLAIVGAVAAAAGGGGNDSPG